MTWFDDVMALSYQCTTTFVNVHFYATCLGIPRDDVIVIPSDVIQSDVISYSVIVIVRSAAVVPHLHKKLCVVEHRVEGALGEVAAGSSEVGLPEAQAGVQDLQALLNVLHHAHLQRGNPEVVDKHICWAVLLCMVGVEGE